MTSDRTFPDRGHLPDLLNDNRLMHKRIAEQDAEIERLHTGLRTLKANCPEERCENGKIRAFGEIVDCENCAAIDALLSASVHEPEQSK